MGSERPVIEVGVAFVVRGPDGRVLLHRRPEDDGWSPPSGTLRGGERIGAALARELEEETGLAVGPARLVAIHSDPDHQVIRTPDGQLTHFITAVFTCEATADGFRPGAEATAWAWCDPASLPALTRFARAYLEDALGERREVTVR